MKKYYKNKYFNQWFNTNTTRVCWENYGLVSFGCFKNSRNQVSFLCYIHGDIVPDIGLAVRVFANGPGDLGSIPGRVIPKSQKMVLDASLLNTQHYKVRIKGKVGQSREGVAPSSTLWCSSYRKGSLRVTLDYGRQLYLLTWWYMISFYIFLMTLNQNMYYYTICKYT